MDIFVTEGVVEGHDRLAKVIEVLIDFTFEFVLQLSNHFYYTNGNSFLFLVKSLLESLIEKQFSLVVPTEV